jgi:hypothetical protein
VTHPQLRKAITYLAEHCDGASTRDTEGFNRGDAAYGARMAVEMASGEDLDAREQFVILEILGKYRNRQLDPAGIALPTVEDLEAWTGSPKPEDLSHAREHVLSSLQRRESERKAAERKLREASLPEAIVSRQGALDLLASWDRKTPRFEQLLSAIRTIDYKHRRFQSSPSTGWVVPVALLPQLRAALAPFRVEWKDGLADIVVPAPSAPSAPGVDLGVPAPAPARAPIRVSFTHDNKRIRVDYDYNERLIDAFRSVTGGKFESTVGVKHWTFPPSKLGKLLEALDEWSGSLSYSPEIEQRVGAARTERAEEIAAERRQAEARRRMSEAALVAFSADKDRVTEAGYRLRDFQAAGVERILSGLASLYGVVVADDMGLGKTAEGLVTMRALRSVHPVKILVVAPGSVRDNWRREARYWETPIEVFSDHYSKIPHPLEHSDYVVLVDEAHKFQNPTSKRGEALDRLAKSERCLAVLPLTGTPDRNGRPSNLFPLLRLIRHPVAKNKRKYEARYCNAGETPYSKWDTTGASNLEELHEKIKDGLLRRRKQDPDIMAELPDKTRVFRQAEMTAEERRFFEAEIDRLTADYERRVEESARITREADRDLAAGLITPEEYEARTKDCISSEGGALVALTHLRHAASRAKVPSTIELAEDILAEGRQVVVFTEFEDTAREVAAHFRVPHLHGGVPTEGKGGDVSPRTKMVDDFQAGRTRVFVGTIKAGGVGITLTAASDVILQDRAWVPGDCIQAEDRCWRMGQKNAVVSYWIQAFEIDEKIDDLIVEKNKRAEIVLSGKAEGLSGTKMSASSVLRSLKVRSRKADDKETSPDVD